MRRLSQAAQTRDRIRVHRARAFGADLRSPLARALFCLALASAGSHPLAEPVYKTVDAEGRVTYSSRPPAQGTPHVEKVKIHGEPDSNEPAPPVVDPAAARAARTQAIAAAQQRAIRAKAALEQAKIQDGSDWVSQPDSSRVLSAEYFKRVAAAERDVESTERDLAQARQMSE
jgi:hypothetical protein